MTELLSKYIWLGISLSIAAVVLTFALSNYRSLSEVARAEFDADVSRNIMTEFRQFNIYNNNGFNGTSSGGSPIDDITFTSSDIISTILTHGRDIEIEVRNLERLFYYDNSIKTFTNVPHTSDFLRAQVWSVNQRRGADTKNPDRTESTLVPGTYGNSPIKENSLLYLNHSIIEYEEIQSIFQREGLLASNFVSHLVYDFGDVIVRIVFTWVPPNV